MYLCGQTFSDIHKMVKPMQKPLELRVNTCIRTMTFPTSKLSDTCLLASYKRKVQYLCFLIELRKKKTSGVKDLQFSINDIVIQKLPIFYVLTFILGL